jgi:hypothetical protein
MEEARGEQTKVDAAAVYSNKSADKQAQAASPRSSAVLPQ